MSQLAKVTQDTGGLVPLSAIKIREELNLVDPDVLNVSAETENPALAKQADKYADILINFGQKDFEAQEVSRNAVENMGLEIQQQSARKSAMLQEPVKKLSRKGADGGDVANALVDLKMQVTELDPNRLDLLPGWFSRMAGAIPGVGTALERYFTKYESSQTVIDVIIQSLEAGRSQLVRDNGILSGDQVEMRKLTFKLEKAIELGRMIDKRLEAKLTEISQEDPKYKFVQEELLFPLRQRIIDLQQQLAVNQQGILAMEIVIRNNKELIRGVNRALTITVSSLQVAVVVALAMTNQSIVLDKINALNTTTSELIRGTAARLKTQGVEIHKQSSSAMLDMNALKETFKDLAAALEKNLSRFGIYNGEVTPALFVLFKASSRLSIFPETMSFLSLHLCFSVRNYPQFSHIGLALLTCSPIPSLCLVMYSKIPIIYF